MWEKDRYCCCKGHIFRFQFCRLLDYRLLIDYREYLRFVYITDTTYLHTFGGCCTTPGGDGTHRDLDHLAMTTLDQFAPSHTTQLLSISSVSCLFSSYDLACFLLIKTCQLNHGNCEITLDCAIFLHVQPLTDTDHCPCLGTILSSQLSK